MTEQEWLTSDDPQAMLTYLLGSPYSTGASWQRRESGEYEVTQKFVQMPRKISDRKLRLFACACCQLSELLTNDQARQAVDVAERFVDGKATNDDMGRAYLFGIESDFTGASIVYESVLVDNAYRGVQRIRHTNRVPPAVQAALLREIAGNPFRPVTLQCCPKCQRMKRTSTLQEFGPCTTCHGVGGIAPWLTPTVLTLAQAAYEERWDWCPCFYAGQAGADCQRCHGLAGKGFLDPVRLSILADALEESGCDSEELLRHLRGYRPCYYCFDNPAIDRGADEWCAYCGVERWLGPYGDFGLGPHVRGCHVVDALLGKE